MLQFTFLFLCEFQDCGDKFHQPGNEHFALSLTSGCYDYCAYILQQAVVSEVIIYSRLFILFTLQSGNIHNIHNLIVGVHAMDGQSPSKEWWLLKPKNGLDNKSSKITHPFQMNQYWPGKKTHSSNPHLRKSGPGKPQNAGRFSGGVTCLLVLPQGKPIYHTTSQQNCLFYLRYLNIIKRWALGGLWRWRGRNGGWRSSEEATTGQGHLPHSGASEVTYW